jgi:hypothetical protein
MRLHYHRSLEDKFVSLCCHEESDCSSVVSHIASGIRAIDGSLLLM